MKFKAGKIISFFFPEHCVVCNNIYSGTSDIKLCPDCRKKLVMTKNMRTCKICSRPVQGQAVLCGDCAENIHNYFLHISCFIYRFEGRRSILNFKFRNRHHQYRTFARIMTDRIKSFGSFPKPDFITFAPLHKSDLADRGYNQSQLIAEEVGRLLGIPVREVFAKVKKTQPQRSVPHEMRRKNVKGAFSVTDTKSITDKTILIIDDVYTTGATMDELSELLVKNGAKKCVCATMAIVLRV